MDERVCERKTYSVGSLFVYRVRECGSGLEWRGVAWSGVAWRGVERNGVQWSQ